VKTVQSWAGVDVGDRRKGFHVAVVDRARVFELKRYTSPLELAAWLRDLKPELTAIDSPCAPAPRGESSRHEEREFARAGICGIRWTPDPDALQANARYYGWILNGFHLYAALRAGGLATVECFPTASWTRWGGRRGARRRSEWSQATLASLAVELPARRLSQDDRDAIGAALTARAHADGCTESYGQIVVPAPRHS
jgi:predicted nuclease with RNAse H fold